VSQAFPIPTPEVPQAPVARCPRALPRMAPPEEHLATRVPPVEPLRVCLIGRLNLDET
jgi:hypothetical protein